MKIPAVLIAVALLGGSSTFAASSSDRSSASSSARSTGHELMTDAKLAMHKLGVATRHALHRADAALHRDRDHPSKS